MPFKHIFGAQIENMLENHADQREMVLLFSLLFYVVATSEAITSDFSSALDYSTSLKKATSYVITPCMYRFCFALGTSVSRGFFQCLRTGSKTCSIQMLWICNVVERTFGLQGKHSLILFARLLLLLSSSFDTRTRTRQKRQRTCTSMFFKQNVTPLSEIYHQRVCRRASIG